MFALLAIIRPPRAASPPHLYRSNMVSKKPRAAFPPHLQRSNMVGNKARAAFPPHLQRSNMVGKKPNTVEGVRNGRLPIPMYYQWNYQEPYGDGTIANCGCGPSSFAMVATYECGYDIDPPAAIEWCGNDYYCPGVGTYWSYFQAAADHFGIGEVVQTGDDSYAYSALQNGQPVISSQTAGIFTSGGHFIVLSGLDDDGLVLVNDPNDNSDKDFYDRSFDFDSEIAATSAQYWIFP